MEWREIESRQNSVVKFAASLHEKKVRDRCGLIVAEGITLFSDLCGWGFFPETVYLSAGVPDLAARVEEMLGGEPCECYRIAPSAFEKITTEKGSEGIVSVYAAEKLRKKLPLTAKNRLVALEAVQDPGNVGTIIRSAASFGFDGVLLTGCADPFGTKAVRASMGAAFRIPVRAFSDTDAMFDFLDENGVISVAACLSSDAVSILETPLCSPVCVVIGNEGNGLSQKAIGRSKIRSMIPIEQMESLNAAAAAAIYLWEIRKGKGKA